MGNRNAVVGFQGIPWDCDGFLNGIIST